MTYALMPIFSFYTTSVYIFARIFLHSQMFINSEIIWALPYILVMMIYFTFYRIFLILKTIIFLK